ncbi:MAG: (2Fe-2S)-binding protein [Bdellovibrionales bacterium]|nr:(2Fe-2S)-binding protein [Bdellovibrionales bacterium]
MKVKFVPQNIELEIALDQTIKEVADKNGIFIKSICNGLPSCSECRIKIVEGEYNVLPPGLKEINLLGNGYFIDQRRLSCQVKCFGDVTVDMTEQIEKEKNIGPRRPQGSRKTEAEVSHAVAGNLLEQENVLNEMVEEKPANSRGSDRQGQNQNRGQNRGGRGGQSQGGGRGGQNQKRQGRNSNSRGANQSSRNQGNKK